MQGHVSVFSPCEFMLLVFHLTVLMTHDLRGICFGAGGVIERSDECFYTQIQSLISKLCMFLVSVRHSVIQGHVGRNNLSLSSYINKVESEHRGV